MDACRVSQTFCRTGGLSLGRQRLSRRRCLWSPHTRRGHHRIGTPKPRLPGVGCRPWNAVSPLALFASLCLSQTVHLRESGGGGRRPFWASSRGWDERSGGPLIAIGTGSWDPHAHLLHRLAARGKVELTRYYPLLLCSVSAAPRRAADRMRVCCRLKTASAPSLIMANRALLVVDDVLLFCSS